METAFINIRFPLNIRAGHDPLKTAKLLDRNGRTSYNGQTYRSPSGAGKEATGWKSCNGWTFWRFCHPDTGTWLTIQELRDQV
jgi:hypothetical protein